MKTILLVILLPLSVLSQEAIVPEIPGWTLSTDEPVYTPDNLWDIIDGAADLFLEYGFVDLHLARYRTADSIELRAEMYRHSSEENAFGMYAQERDPSYHFLQLGAQGYLQEGVLNFLDGPYYIKLSSLQTGPNVQAALRKLGAAIEAKFGQPSDLPPIVRMFPKEGQIPNTAQYFAMNFLGYAFLKNVYVQTYSGRPPLKVFVVLSDNREESEKVLAAWRRAIPKECWVEKGAERMALRDPNAGPISLLRNGRHLVGVTGSGDAARCDSLLRATASNLP